MSCGWVLIDIDAVMAAVAAVTAAETAAATIDSVVEVGCDGGDGDVLTARTCDGREETARRSGTNEEKSKAEDKKRVEEK